MYSNLDVCVPGRVTNRQLFIMEDMYLDIMKMSINSTVHVA